MNILIWTWGSEAFLSLTYLRAMKKIDLFFKLVLLELLFSKRWKFKKVIDILEQKRQL